MPDLTTVKLSQIKNGHCMHLSGTTLLDTIMQWHETDRSTCPRHNTEWCVSEFVEETERCMLDRY